MQRRLQISALLRLLGRTNENPIATRVYGEAAITLHTLDSSVSWRWAVQDAGAAFVGMVFAQGDVRLGLNDEHLGAAPDCFLLDPTHALDVTAADGANAMIVWVPWSVAAEIDVSALPMRIAPSPLTIGLRAFASALVGRSAAPTMYTDYMIERLLAEMVFGAMVEATATGPANREATPIERARSLMMVRRADPTFGVDEIARELHVSPRQLQRIFSAAGQSPTDELRRLRVELAADLLDRPECAPLSIEEIALYSGFRAASSLRRAFASYGLAAPSRRRSIGSSD